MLSTTAQSWGAPSSQGHREPPPAAAAGSTGLSISSSLGAAVWDQRSLPLTAKVQWQSGGGRTDPSSSPQTQLVRSDTSLLVLQRSLNLTAKSQAAAEPVWFPSLLFFQYFARPFSGQIIDSTAEQMPWAAGSTLAAGSWGKGERNDCVLICH